MYLREAILYVLCSQLRVWLFFWCYSFRCSKDLLEAVVGTLEIDGTNRRNQQLCRSWRWKSLRLVMRCDESRMSWFLVFLNISQLLRLSAGRWKWSSEAPLLTQNCCVVFFGDGCVPLGYKCQYQGSNVDSCRHCVQCVDLQKSSWRPLCTTMYHCTAFSKVGGVCWKNLVEMRLWIWNWRRTGREKSINIHKKPLAVTLSPLPVTAMSNSPNFDICKLRYLPYDIYMYNIYMYNIYI